MSWSNRFSATKRVPSLLTAMVVLALQACALAAEAEAAPAATPAAPAVVSSPWVELVKALAWPVAALVLLILYRRPLGDFLSGVSSRISKFSAFGATVEIATFSTARVLTAPILDELKSNEGALATDSSGTLLRSLLEGPHADFVIVNVGEGREWFNTRLYILCALLQRTRPVRRIVFLEGVDGQFLGTCRPSELFEAMDAYYGYLRIAYEAAHATNYDVPPLLIGRLSAQQAQTLLSMFLGKVQAAVDPKTPGWIEVGASQYRAAYWEEASWLTGESLRSLLGGALETRRLERNPSEDGATAGQTLLRHDEPLVAVVDTQGRFHTLIDRIEAMDTVMRSSLSGKG